MNEETTSVLVELVIHMNKVLYCMDRLADSYGVDLLKAVQSTSYTDNQQMDLPLFLTDGRPIRNGEPSENHRRGYSKSQ